MVREAAKEKDMKIACATALAVAVSFTLQQPAQAHRDSPPPVPGNIQVPAGNRLFLQGHAVGTQDYICLPSATSTTGFAWIQFGPQATLFDDDNRQIITHFLSVNPDDGLPRATWQHSRDTSSVWAQAIATSTDAAFVAPGAIPWLLLQWVGRQDGPTGGDTLAETTYIQRLNTYAGVAPSTGCAVSADVGKKSLVAYEADYFFFKKRDRHDDRN
jgi:hypothetical protein